MHLRRPVLAAVPALVLLGVGLPPAAAHVDLTPSTTAAGAPTVLTFETSHGCEGSPTTSLTITVPEIVLDVQPTLYPGWDVEKVEGELSTPLELSDGTTIETYTAAVVYTAQEPVEDGYRVAFEVGMRNPYLPGERLSFPTVQTCEDGEIEWSDPVPEGQDPHEMDTPAPTYTVTEEGSGGHAHGDGTTEDAAHEDGHDESAHDEADATGDADVEAAAPAPVTVEEQGTPVVAWIALAVGLAGAVLGGLSLARGRRTS
jgi:periplasmic copper chaperone A